MDNRGARARSPGTPIDPFPLTAGNPRARDQVGEAGEPHRAAGIVGDALVGGPSFGERRRIRQVPHGECDQTGQEQKPEHSAQTVPA